MVRAILRTRGRERIDVLAGELGIHRRRLERAFARELGIRPKLFARIVRLNSVLAGLGTELGARTVERALEAGYFDQAHLARDFRAVAGRTAGRSSEEDGRLGRHFTDPERLLVHLAGE
jgi:transcriptional regulator GlxA family with amidase domain